MKILPLTLTTAVQLHITSGEDEGEKFICDGTTCNEARTFEIQKYQTARAAMSVGYRFITIKDNNSNYSKTKMVCPDCKFKHETVDQMQAAS